jgi:hypothetical protein
MIDPNKMVRSWSRVDKLVDHPYSREVFGPMRDDEYEFLKNDIAKHGFRRPIDLLPDCKTIIGGTQRVRVARDLGIEEVPIQIVPLTKEQEIKEFIILDNLVRRRLSEQQFYWAIGKLSELYEVGRGVYGRGRPKLEDANVASPNGDVLERTAKHAGVSPRTVGYARQYVRAITKMPDLKDASVAEAIDRYQVREAGGTRKLEDVFLVPPFSILDARARRWIDRKQEWRRLIGRGLEGRAGKLVFGYDDRDSAVEANFMHKRTGFNWGTSAFDPVLAEIIYRWFNVEGGRVLDPYAGGITRGMVAAALGFDYVGIDISEEQVRANKGIVRAVRKLRPKYICDDSLEMNRHIEDGSVDLVFTCPPYYDLEVYDTPGDLSNKPTYDEFLEAYGEIIRLGANKLKDNRFCVYVVGDVRDREGIYRGLVHDTAREFRCTELHLYGEMVLITAPLSASFRASRYFKWRKIAPTHQSVLVFYKGDPGKIHDQIPKEFPEEPLAAKLEVPK